MLEFKLDENDIVIADGTSEGTQIKYYKNGYWYKKDKDGKEGLCEYLASKLLTFSSLDPSEYIIYEQEIINGKSGCRSKNYLNKDEEFITLYRLYYNEFGKNLSEVIAGYERMEDRIKLVLDFVKNSTGVDLSDYLSKIFTLDRIILNEDRHVNNLAIIEANGIYRVAPIFDNGRSLLTANQSVRWNTYGISENVKRVSARPFSGSFQKMYEYFGRGFEIDYDAAFKWLQGEPESRERDILIYQLENVR